MKKKILIILLLVGIFNINIIKNNAQADEVRQENPTEASVEIGLLGDLSKGNERKNGNPKKPLDIKTYVKFDNHAVHPRVIYDKNKQFKYPWIMVFTPYSFMDDQKENPSIVVSEDGINWKNPEGLENPIVGKVVPENTHYSDPDIFINGKEIELWYRQSDKEKRLSKLCRIKSKDLINWSKEEVIFDYGTGGYGYGASTIVFKDGEYNLYYREHMDMTREGYVYRKSKDTKNWTEPAAVTFDYGPTWSNFHAWHIEIDYINGKYYALNMAYPQEKAEGAVLFAFDSEDGINFKNPVKVIEPTKDGFDNNNIYKSSLAIKDKEIYLYYSAYAKDKQNHIGLLKGPTFMELEAVEGTGGGYISLRKIFLLGAVTVVAVTGIGIVYFKKRKNKDR
ncbi:hypothetical protein [Miniphocaeibacter halophilus]|uniref:Uncharacterized protein n=1 Tax=Miniphocaeibacter halophilus TaxID=2931922 RepID=A0AC61MME0_9FIRM|nr:hypothetical protein [Miniphocaeibacter halophilus]QQK06876.1 hypothetical protein JFY71_05875 [Miniphocaeibacter halophilus]